MNHLKTTLSSISILFLLCSFAMASYGKVKLTKLVCEYHENPIGIDVVHPRLSWQLIAEDKNVSQTAYEIRVAKSVSDLSKKSKQLWATGKVDSDQSLNVVYEGTLLNRWKGHTGRCGFGIITVK